MCLHEMLLCKDQTNRPSPKFSLAKAFSHVTSMLLGIDGMTALGHVSHRIQDLQEEGITGAHLEMLPTLGLSAGPLPTRGKVGQVLWAVPSIWVSPPKSQSPRPLC